MADEPKRKPDDDLDFIPRNANIGIVAIGKDGGTGLIATSDSPVIAIASSGDVSMTKPEVEEDDQEPGDSAA